MKERLWALLARHEVDRQGQASSPEQRKRVTRVDLDLACAGWRHGIKGTPAARHKHTTLTAPVQEHAEGYGTCSSCIGQGLLCAAVVCGVPLRRTKCTARQRRRQNPCSAAGGFTIVLIVLLLLFMPDRTASNRVSDSLSTCVIHHRHPYVCAGGRFAVNRRDVAILVNGDDGSVGFARIDVDEAAFDLHGVQ